MAEEIVNLFETTLASDLTNIATTMALTDISGPGGSLGTGGTWRFTLGRDSDTPEIVTGTARSSSNVTITRAQGGTSAQTWSAGTKVTLSITKEGITALINDTAYHSGGTDVAVADGGTGASNASGARTNLNLVIGTDVEAHDADLTTIAGLSPSNDDIIQRKSSAWTNRTMAQLVADLVLPINAQSGTSYTLVLGDAGQLVTLTNGSSITLTVPTNASVAYAAGTTILLFQGGAGQVTVAGAGGVTVNSRGSALKIAGQYGAATLIKTATDTWFLTGDITT